MSNLEDLDKEVQTDVITDNVAVERKRWFKRFEILFEWKITLEETQSRNKEEEDNKWFPPTPKNRRKGKLRILCTQ